MTVALRHAVDDAGYVVLTLTDADGVRHPARFTASDAKKAAWRILADLDPDEAEAALREQTARERRHLTLGDRALLAIARGCVTVAEITDTTRLSGSAICAQLKALRETGLAVNHTRGSGRGAIARYELTEMGRRRAASLEGALN